MPFGSKNRVRVQTSVEGVGQSVGELGRFRQAFDNVTSSKGGKTLLQGVGLGAGLGAWNLLQGAISGVVDVAGDMIAKSRDEEVGISRLDAALKANISGWDGNRDAIEKVIASRERLAFSDGEQRDALAQLVTRTHNVTKALDLEREAMDLARLKGWDLAQATEIIGKVYGGNVGILTRYGIAVTKGADSTQALADIQKAAADQAEAFARTQTGSLKATSIAFDDFEEAIGKGLIDASGDANTSLNDELVTGLGATTDALGAAGKALAAFNAKQAAMAGELVNDVKPAFEALQPVADWWADTFGNNIDASFKLASQGFDEFTGATEQTGQAFQDFRAAERDAENQGTTFGGVINDLTASTKDLHQAYGPVIVDLRTLKQKFDDATAAIDDNLFATGNLTRSWQENKLALKDDIDKLRELEGIRNPTRAQREDILKTKDAIADDKQGVIDASLKLLEMGKIGFPTLMKRLGNIGLKLMDDSDAARELRTLLYEIDSAKGSRAGHGGGGGGRPHPTSDGNATGGYIPRGAWSTVGEEGAEGIHMLPGGGAYVTSAGQPGGGGGGETHVHHTHVYLDGRQIAEVVDRELYYMSGRAPQTLTSR